MPSKTEKQHKFMEAVAHNKEFAEKAGVPQKVGKEFAKADEKKESMSERREELKKRRK